MLRVAGLVAGIAAWLGWLTVCPAFGFPSLATAAMLNRVLAPRSDPGSWPGWGLVLIGLAAAGLLYLLATDRGRVRASIASGSIYGVILWLAAGAILMPVLGALAPATASAPSPTPSAPDAMQAAFMMLPLGIGAPIAALVAWVLFGAVVGAIAAASPAYPSTRDIVRSLSARGGGTRVARSSLVAVAAIVVAVLAIGAIALRSGPSPTVGSSTATRLLGTETTKTLPKGADLFSVIELSQPPGATLGPHAHAYFGYAYGLEGVATIDFGAGRTTRVGPGAVGFIGLQMTHAHENTDDRLPSGALAIVIVGLAVAACVISLRAARDDGRILPIVLVLLIGAGAAGAYDPWANDWLFLSVRSASARGGPMPLATSSRTYESPDFGPLSPGPFTETFKEITLVADGSADAGSNGARLVFVLRGRVEVLPTAGSIVRLDTHGATLLEPGTSARLTDTAAGPAEVIEVAVSSSGSS